VQTSATLSLLELLVHTDPDLIPRELVSVLEIPESFSIQSIDLRQFAEGLVRASGARGAPGYRPAAGTRSGLRSIRG